MNIRNIVKKILDTRPFQLRAVLYIYNYIILNTTVLLKIARLRYPVSKNDKFLFNKPETLQFPVTNRCNLNCKMCGLLTVDKTKELEPQQLVEIFRNKVFKNIRNIGINGGEPFLQKNLLGYIEASVTALHKVKNIYIISNGTLQNNISSVLSQIKALCSSNNIKLTFSISIDGVGDVHDLVRGKMGTFVNVENTCSMIKSNMHMYCDNFGILCTITKYNIYQINEVDAWAKYNGYSISYNIATQHARLRTDSLDDDFTVFANEHTKLMAAEFFYGKLIETRSPIYYALYKYITDNKRATGCEFKYNGITVLADGSIAYCATRSRVIGNALLEDADIVYDQHRSYRDSYIFGLCDSCSHYTGELLLKDRLEYNREILKIIGSPFTFR